MNAILTVARKEFRDGWRNRWVLAITAIFALFALGIAYFGAAASGMVGFTSLSTTIVSLSSLVIFLIPLIALLLGYDSIVGEEEQGTLLLLLSYPLSRSQLLLGKLVGQGGILAAATIIGFGAAAVVITLFSDEVAGVALWRAFAAFIFSATLLGWAFLALAYLISVVATEKARAAGIALLVWFFFVLIFDLVMLGALVAAGSSTATDWLPWLLLLNPTDVFRLINLTGFETAKAYTGLTAIAGADLFSPRLLTAILVAWVAVPLAAAIWFFRRRHQ